MISQITFNRASLSEIDPVTLNTLKTLYAGAAVTLDDRVDDQRMVLEVTSDCSRTGTFELAAEVEDQLRSPSWM